MSMTQVTCPRCNAFIGKKCITTGRTGKQKKRKDHTARIHAALRMTPSLTAKGKR